MASTFAFYEKKMGKCFQVSKERSCYQDLLPLLASCSGIYAAVQVRLNRQFSSNPNDGFVIGCKHLDSRVVLPLHGPIEDALANHQPNGIGIGVLPSRVTPPKPDDFMTTGFKTLFDTLVQPYLTNQFERHRIAMFKKHGGDRTKLPDAWQMAWAVRNGLSHNGRVHFDVHPKAKKDPDPVHWRGLTISIDHQDQPILGNFLNVGDLIVLSLDMEEAISGALPWTEMDDQPTKSAV